ncbi:MAG: type II toxin-antitoxin system RelE/ParE family toxin [Clostridiales bacterium]|nr:type II toxin-antitoxin system RelE/ParE family toxin [Clostridiales bacterium]
MFKLLYANEVGRDLQAIYDYIAQDSPERASQYIGKIENSVLRLRDFPNIGHNSSYDELNALGVRILPFDDYLIFYIVKEKDETVYIVRVLHGSVDYKHLF